jgi:hypothetical protein
MIEYAWGAFASLTSASKHLLPDLYVFKTEESFPNQSHRKTTNDSASPESARSRSLVPTDW